MKKAILLSVAVLLNVSMLSAQSISQEVYSASGGDAEVDGISISWTIGECVVETFEGSNAILTQGFHQGDYTITDIEQITETNFDITVYPNPTDNLLNLKMTNPEENQTGALLVELLDMNGKVLLRKNWKDHHNIEKIQMSRYTKSMYLLRVSEKDGTPVKLSKIQKVR